MRKRLFLSLMLGLAPCLGADEALGAPSAATVIDVKPKVEFSSASSGKKELKAGASLYAGDSMATSAFGSIALVMADGSLVRLGANTEVVLKEAKLEAKGSSVFSLAKGLLQAMVSKQGSGFFSVQTKHGVAAVKGTQLQVEEGPESAELKVLTGAVELSSADGAAKLSVAAGEKALSYKDRVGELKKMNKAEIQELRKAFKDRVFTQKSAYSKRVKDLKK